MNTIGQLLANSPLPRLESRLLLMFASGLPKTKVMAFPEVEVSADQAALFRQLVARRVAGEPIAYLLGEREFYGRMFAVSPAVLIPRPETELLVELAMERLRGVDRPRILDMGTGSGIVAITLALELPAAEVWALDVSEAALAVAQTNAQALGARVQFVRSDWYSQLPADLRFDLIASNPPYIETNDHHLSEGDLRFEPQNALTDFGDGLSCLRQIYGQAKHWLKPQSWVLAEHGYQQGQASRDLCVDAGLVDVGTEQDLAGLDRVTGGRMGKPQN